MLAFRVADNAVAALCVRHCIICPLNNPKGVRMDNLALIAYSVRAYSDSALVSGAPHSPRATGIQERTVITIHNVSSAQARTLGNNKT